MPCFHKFLQFLNLERLDFIPTTLIVGTFNPEWPETNQAKWFYGRTHDKYGKRNNNLWDVLPKIYGENSLIDKQPTDWKYFCERNKIAFTDLIVSIEDANRPQHDRLMGSYSDSTIGDNFHQHIFNDIVGLLKKHPSIKNVYLTRGPGNFWNALWYPVKQYATANGLHERQILTPSKNARFAMAPFNRKNPLQTFNMATLNDFILHQWRNNWHDL